MWYRRELYSEHNESMDRFIEKFNSYSVHTNLLMLRLPRDFGKHDGIFIDLETQQSIGFDWLKFHQEIFTNGELKYKKLSIVNSKLDIESTKIFVETDLREEEIVIAWREDILKENTTYFYDKVQSLNKTVKRDRRLTDKFKIYNYNEICSFKKLVYRALQTETYNINLK